MIGRERAEPRRECGAMLVRKLLGMELDGGVFIVEKLRQQMFTGKLDDEVRIGWDAKDSILVTD